MASPRRAQGNQPRARAAPAVVPKLGTSRLVRFLPSLRSVLVGVALLVTAIGGYAALRASSAFTIRHIVVSGASPKVAAEVRRALAPFRGRSLLGLDGGELARRVEALPSVESVGYDRNFPHTLHLTVAAERPVAVLHRGTETWLLSARGRVITKIPTGTRPGLARIWIPRKGRVDVGEPLLSEPALVSARAVALATRFPLHIATASVSHGELTFHLRSGLQLDLGEPSDIRLKLAIVRRALHGLPAGTTYLDVSLPGRPVAGTANPQVSSGG
ncbi:MAG TPA: FtsQ-type POTRA domain-containing protein [Gaiellaceae bacterium]